ncbi:hypothetical protein GCM10010532_030510 [Dactylosporangium siamense]|uniref:Uncharacterized protein n=1 Tax=Dactylosporangium siamense TaxID=685454 RepID=A0A919PHY6_9ACTN|nr:hypothetical protein Dsi01nite_020400 [Dactylosporangium siamense]
MRTRSLWLASPFVAVAVLAIAVEVYAHRNPRNYLALRPVAEYGPTFAVALAVPVLLALAVLVAAPPGSFRTVTAWVLVALVLPVGCVGGLADPLVAAERQVRSSTTATRSSDGRWEVVIVGYTYHSDSDGYLDEFVLRSRAGWLSREAPRPLAFIWHSSHQVQVEVVRVEIPAPGAIELHTSDGAVHRTTFDPAGLAIADRFEQCGDEGQFICP